MVLNKLKDKWMKYEPAEGVIPSLVTKAFFRGGNVKVMREPTSLPDMSQSKTNHAHEYTDYTT